jgi:two-component sensor histidine kinase
LTDVAKRALDAFTPAQVQMSGDAIEVSPKHALALSLALHEFATNALKYGALTSPEGRITTQWGVQEGTLRLDWEERGGPPVRPPTQKGFGTRLLEDLLVRDLGGHTKLDYKETGVRCSITAVL